MTGEKLIWNSEQNFLFRARKAGIACTDIAETACQFFATDLILEAKKFLSTEAAVSTRATDRQKMIDNVD